MFSFNLGQIGPMFSFKLGIHNTDKYVMANEKNFIGKRAAT